MSSPAVVTCALRFALDAQPFAHAALAAAFLARSRHGDTVEVELVADGCSNPPVTISTSTDAHFKHCTAVLRYLARVYLPNLYETQNGVRDPKKSTTIDIFLHESVALADFAALRVCMLQINHFLSLNTYLVAFEITLADFHLWGEFKSNPAFCQLLKGKTLANEFPNLLRWFNLVDNLPCVHNALQAMQTKRQLANKSKKDQGLIDVDLPGANADSVVVTRFPPEPSGYMHIGHAKAVLLNEYYARKYKKGRLILRFDDTNPSKEKIEFEETIETDVQLLGVKPDTKSHTSDHFETIISFADQLIADGHAYVDNTDKETMRHQRMAGEPSACRDQSVCEAARRWAEMQKASEFGLTCCLRARMSVDDANKALRDPVLYRCNLTPHHRTGKKFNVYPTYDFACPVVDSVEGVTHALRTSEYRDRNAQYEWIQKHLRIRKVQIVDFSRLNFVYTLLSKRKLQWFVENEIVAGWDDPRFPTVRGMLRRGLTVEALRTYVLMQGASHREMLLEWDKIWSLNCRVVDPVAPRHVAVVRPIPMTLVPGNDEDDEKEKNEKNQVRLPQAGEIVWKLLDAHKKNPAAGKKRTAFGCKLLIEVGDAKSMVVGEEVTLMDWGNALVTEIKRGVDGAIEAVTAKLNLGGDVKSTKLKLTWLVSGATADIVLRDYDYLITKKKLEEGDEFRDFVTPRSVFEETAQGDLNLLGIKAGTVVQLERRGFYVCDCAGADSTANSLGKRNPVFICVPDGKAGSVASKHETSLGRAAGARRESKHNGGSTARQNANVSASDAVKIGTAIAARTMCEMQSQQQSATACSVGTAAYALGAAGRAKRRVSFSDDAIAQLGSPELIAFKEAVQIDADEKVLFANERRRSSVRGRLRSPPPPV